VNLLHAMALVLFVVLVLILLRWGGFGLGFLGGYGFPILGVVVLVLLIVWLVKGAPSP
jgi:uncharacterized membrane protein YkvI